MNTRDLLKQAISFANKGLAERLEDLGVDEGTLEWIGPRRKGGSYYIFLSDRASDRMIHVFTCTRRGGALLMTDDDSGLTARVPLAFQNIALVIASTLMDPGQAGVMFLRAQLPMPEPEE